MEYGVKNALQELCELRGVVGYAALRFWVDDAGSAAGTDITIRMWRTVLIRRLPV